MNNILYYHFHGGFLKKLFQKIIKPNKKHIIDSEIIKITPEEKPTQLRSLSIMKKAKITDEQIDNISYFLTHVLPKCNKIGITLDEIKKGEILGSGTFGHSYQAGNKVIKIIIYNKYDKNVQDEFLIHIKLMNTEQSNYFIKLYGYIKKEYNINTNVYKYYDVENKKDSCIYKINKKNNKKFSKFLDNYGFMEVGSGNLSKLLKNNFNITTITDKFYDLINFYKVSEKFIKTEKKVFIHCDIKIDNILFINKNDTKDDTNYDLKIIDFGLSKLSSKFINKSSYTPLYYLYYNTDFKILPNDDYTLQEMSPCYDIFCLILSYINFLLPNKNIENYYEKENNKYTDLLKLINFDSYNDNDKLKMYKLLCIGWIFVNGNKITDKTIIINNINIKKPVKTLQQYYDYMDNIIKSVCVCKSIQDIKSINCDNIEFDSILKK